MLTSKDIQIGQTIEAGFWFRCGRHGGDIDRAVIVGKVIRKLDCYNQVLVDVDIEKSFNPPRTSEWVELDKADVDIIN